MEALRVHYVSELNAAREPYYDPPFAQTRDRLRVTMPQDDVAGCVYLVQQLLTPGGARAHYLRVLRLLVARLGRSQAAGELLQKPAAQALLWCLARGGELEEMGSARAAAANAASAGSSAPGGSAPAGEEPEEGAPQAPPAPGAGTASPPSSGDADDAEEARALCFQGLRLLCASPSFFREGLGWRGSLGLPPEFSGLGGGAGGAGSDDRAGSADRADRLARGGDGCEAGGEPLPPCPPCQAFVAVPGAAPAGPQTEPRAAPAEARGSASPASPASPDAPEGTPGPLCASPADPPDPREAPSLLALFTRPLAEYARGRAFADWEFVSQACLDYLNTCTGAPGRGGPQGGDPESKHSAPPPPRENILGLERASRAYPIHPRDALALLVGLCLDPRPRVAREAMEFQAALFDTHGREAVALAVAAGACGPLWNALLASVSGLEGLLGAGGRYAAELRPGQGELRGALLAGWGFAGAPSADGADAPAADPAGLPSPADAFLMRMRPYYAAAASVAEHFAEFAPLAHCLAESGCVDALVLLTHSPVTAPEAGRALRVLLQAEPAARDLVLAKGLPGPGRATYPGTLLDMAALAPGGADGPQRDLCELAALLLGDTATCERFGADLGALLALVAARRIGEASAGRLLSAASAYGDSQRRVREFLSVRPGGGLAGAGAPGGAVTFHAPDPDPRAAERGPVSRHYQPATTDRMMPERQLGMRFPE